MRPGLAIVVAGADGNVIAAFGNGRITENEQAFAAIGASGPGIANETGLAHGFDEGGVVIRRLPRRPAVLAQRNAATGFAAIGAAVQHERALGQLDHGALVHAKIGGAAQLPGLAVVVGIDDVRAASLLPACLVVLITVDAMVAGNHEASFGFAACELDAVAGASGVPVPIGFLDVGGDVARLRPGTAIVARRKHENAVVFAVEGKPDDAGVL